MSFEYFITCDRPDCNARVQVPQPGAIPMNWIQVRYAKPNLNPSNSNGEMEAAVLTVCGWKCLLKHVKGFVREEVEIAHAK